MVRGAGRIRFNQHDEPRYLGPSSGIAMNRLVMEIAKQNTESKSIKDVVPELTAQEIKAAFAQEDSKPTSKVYPMISSLPQPDLPPRNLTYKLIDLFVAKGTRVSIEFCGMLPTTVTDLSSQRKQCFRHYMNRPSDGKLKKSSMARLILAITSNCGWSLRSACRN